MLPWNSKNICLLSYNASTKRKKKRKEKEDEEEKHFRETIKGTQL